MLGGLGTSAVHRLKNTFGKLSERSQQELEEIQNEMNPGSSFKNYRDALKKSEPPSIPYL